MGLIHLIGVWIVIGFILFMLTVYLDPDAAKLIQQNEKTMVALIILWPFLLIGLLRYGYRRLSNR